MDKREVIINKVRRYSELVRQVFPVPVEQFWLFGSYAQGKAHEYSDIDVAVVVEHFGSDYNFLETEPVLWKLGNSVDYRIEPHVIARDTDYSGMLSEIEKTGIQI